MSIVSWFGVFNRKGELEAVEESEDMAKIAALNLSPKTKSGAVMLNRKVEPVTVVRGDLADVLQAMVVNAAHTSAARRLEEYAKAIEVADRELKEAIKAKEVMPANYWHDLERTKNVAIAAAKIGLAVSE